MQREEEIRVVRITRGGTITSHGNITEDSRREEKREGEGEDERREATTNKHGEGGTESRIGESRREGEYAERAGEARTII